MTCTIFKNIFSKEPFYVSVDLALKRISEGKSKNDVLVIRETIDKDKANNLKANLPSVCFSGTFEKDRRDIDLIKHSGFLVLDFDGVKNLREKQTEIINHDYVYACWVSPSGKGLKALIRIADGTKHREHFQALLDIFPEVDKSGANPSRVCYESYDPEIYTYPDASIFSTIKKTERIVVTEREQDDYKIFKNLLTWLANRNDAFVTGERNNFIFKLASACCRFGLNDMSAERFIQSEFLVNSDFTAGEASRAIKSGYKANNSKFGSCVFENEILVDKKTKKEIKIDATIYDESIRPKDVIYSVDVKDDAIKIFKHGYAKVDGIGVNEIDERFKLKRGEITLLTGIGNYGKTAFKKWYQVFRAVLFDEKFATFGPEDCPAEEYYHDLTEILLGCDLTPYNQYKPSQSVYERAYDFIGSHFFYVYPENDDPTPEYIMERFLELIIKEKIDGCDIDPFNQLANNYQGFGGRDKYLEFILNKFLRFAQINMVYFWVIAHPKIVEMKDKNYVCPNVFDVADGAMWNNKMCNILVYHRPFAQSEPQNPLVEFHSKKIKRQKIVGKKGFSLFDMQFASRRFYFSGKDPMRKSILDKGLTFDYEQPEIKFNKTEPEGYLPMDTGSNELPF